MTFEELLKSCANGKMPMVQASLPIRHATSRIGTVVVIKQNTSVSGTSGCAVAFPGCGWDTWYHASESEDKRSHYMRELTLVSSPQ